VIVTAGSPVKIIAHLAANSIHAFGCSRIHPGEHRGQCSTTRTQNKKTVHETPDGNGGRSRVAGKCCGNLSQRAFDVIDRQGGAAGGVTVQIPWHVVHAGNLEAFVESSAPNAAGSDVKTQDVHALRLLDCVSAKLISHDGQHLVPEGVRHA